MLLISDCLCTAQTLSYPVFKDYGFVLVVIGEKTQGLKNFVVGNKLKCTHLALYDCRFIFAQFSVQFSLATFKGDYPKNLDFKFVIKKNENPLYYVSEILWSMQTGQKIFQN